MMYFQWTTFSILYFIFRAGRGSLSNGSDGRLYHGPVQNTLQRQSVKVNACLVSNDIGGVLETTATGPGSSSTKDISERITDQLLQCAVCCNRFSNVKVPKLLACSHTFCIICITRWVMLLVCPLFYTTIHTAECVVKIFNMHSHAHNT